MAKDVAKGKAICDAIVMDLEITTAMKDIEATTDLPSFSVLDEVKSLRLEVENELR